MSFLQSSVMDKPTPQIRSFTAHSARVLPARIELTDRHIIAFGIYEYVSADLLLSRSVVEGTFKQTADHPIRLMLL